MGRREGKPSLRSAWRRAPSEKLFQIFSDAPDEEDDTEPCMICNL
jgi:hypothetical protein